MAQASSQPCRAQATVQGNGLVKLGNGLLDSVLRCQQKTLQCRSCGVARCQPKTLSQRGLGDLNPAKSEFKFGNPFPREPEIRRSCHRFAGCDQCFFKFEL